jgi:hypothetical protein
VNETNSTNPSAEREIVSKESYGRQLGRISDALDSLIGQLRTVDKTEKPIAEFLQLKKRIDTIKHESESARFEHVLADLRYLNEHDKPKFDDCLRRVVALDTKRSQSSTS